MSVNSDARELAIHDCHAETWWHKQGKYLQIKSFIHVVPPSELNVLQKETTSYKDLRFPSQVPELHLSGLWKSKNMMQN